jgi:catechol 2,3-dioxygenase-like lactoylglutathione lyase family enzyme
LLAVAEPLLRTRDVPEALVLDPFGNSFTFLHLFRRHPIVSMTLRCSNVEESAAFFTDCLGMRAIKDAQELAELHLPADGLQREALAVGPCHNSVSLVLEPLQESQPYPVSMAPVLSINTTLLEELHAKISAADFDTTPITASAKGKIFMAIGPSGHMLEFGESDG